MRAHEEAERGRAGDRRRGAGCGGGAGYGITGVVSRGGGSSLGGGIDLRELAGTNWMRGGGRVSQRCRGGRRRWSGVDSRRTGRRGGIACLRTRKDGKLDYGPGCERRRVAWAVSAKRGKQSPIPAGNGQRIGRCRRLFCPSDRIIAPSRLALRR